MPWRDDREHAWDFWLHDFLREQVREELVGHRHEGEVDVPSKEVMHALVDTAIVLDLTEWIETELGPELTEMTSLVKTLAEGIVRTYTKEMEER